MVARNAWHVFEVYDVAATSSNAMRWRITTRVTARTRPVLPEMATLSHQWFSGLFAEHRYIYRIYD